MIINFAIGDTPAILSRNAYTGGIKITIGPKTIWLQQPWRLGAHFSLTLKRQWACTINNHHIVVENVRPAIFGGIRAQQLTIYIDKKLVASEWGR